MRDAVVPQMWTKGGTVPAGGLGMKFCHDLPPHNTIAGEVCVKGWGPSSFYLCEYTLMHPKEPNRQLRWDKALRDVESKDLAVKPLQNIRLQKVQGIWGRAGDETSQITLGSLFL